MVYKGFIMLYFVGNKAKGQIQKWVLQKSKARQIFRKTNISYPLIRTHTCIWRALFSCNIRFEIRHFALLPTIYQLGVQTRQSVM